MTSLDSASQHPFAMTPESQASDYISVSYSAALSISFPNWNFFLLLGDIAFPHCPCPYHKALVVRLSQAVRIHKEETYGLDICCSEDWTGYSHTPRLLGATVCMMWAVPVCVCMWGLCSSLLRALTALQQSNDSHSKPALSSDAVSVSRLLRVWRKRARLARGDEE